MLNELFDHSIDQKYCTYLDCNLVTFFVPCLFLSLSTSLSLSRSLTLSHSHISPSLLVSLFFSCVFHKFYTIFLFIFIFTRFSISSSLRKPIVTWSCHNSRNNLKRSTTNTRKHSANILRSTDAILVELLEVVFCLWIVCRGKCQNNNPENNVNKSKAFNAAIVYVMNVVVVVSVV